MNPAEWMIRRKPATQKSQQLNQLPREVIAQVTLAVAIAPQRVGVQRSAAGRAAEPEIDTARV